LPDELSDAELRLIELDENTEREALTDFETTKVRLAEIRQIEARLRAKAVFATSGSKNSKPSKRGRKGEGRPKGRKPGSQRDVAEATGVSQPQQARMERHIGLAEQFPFLQRAEWVRHNVLQAGDLIEQLSSDAQTASAALLDQDAIPLETLAEHGITLRQAHE